MTRTWFRAFAVAAILAVLLAGQGSAISFTEVPCLDLPGIASGATAKLAAGPYLVKMASDSVTIMWQSDVPAVARLIVQSGKSTGEYKTTKPARLNAVRVKGLTPGTRYAYRLWVGASRTLAASQATDTFVTFPTKPGPVSFCAYGDTRSDPDRHARVVAAMAGEKNLAFVLHTGDVVSNGRKLDAWIPGYFAPCHTIIGRVPFYPVRGNHDGSSYYFQLLGFAPGEKWYSFDVLGVHVTALDSGEDFDIGSDQYKWLVSDLEKHKSAKWKIVMLHSPVYSSGPHGAEDAAGVPKEKGVRTARKLLPALAAKYGIRVVFSGHDHAYERSKRDGVSYIVTGGGGAQSYSVRNPNPYKQFFFSGLHYCVVTVDGDKARIVAKTPDGKILDKAEL
jgi:predicted phosphodiesterase